MGDRFRDKYDEKTSRGFAFEEDRVNCPFYFKIGACRNGDRCNRIHQRPEKSHTLLIPHMYPACQETLAVSNDEDWDEETYWKAQEHAEAFYEEVFLELANYGEIEDMVVMDNVSDHMIGSVCVKYINEADTEKAMIELQNRFYGPKLLQGELSPVTDFREAQCRSFHENRCTRGGLCNFMHVKHLPRAFKRKIVRKMYADHPEYKGPNKFRSDKINSERDRSRSPGGGEKKEEKPKDGPKRQTSEERRAMIAEWNREALRETANQMSKAPPPMMPMMGNMVRPPGVGPQVIPATVPPRMIPPMGKQPMFPGIQPIR